MSRTILAVSICLLFSTAFVGCIGTTNVTPDASNTSATSMVRGQLDPRGAGFEFLSETAGDPSNPIQGPFVLRGTNLQYDAVAGEISVDLSVVNLGNSTLPEPVSVTFIGLQPEGISVVNPDNAEHGPGAMIAFAFANDDAVWTPNEESLARPVRFAVSPATSVGFSARMDVGSSVTGGSIGGVVWNDGNRDGLMDIDERGIGGVRLTLAQEQAPNSAAIRETQTNPDGTYRFDDLAPGFYSVVKSATAGLEPTTETTFHVLLIEDESGVRDFLMANFGCVQASEPVVDIAIGDYVEVRGDFLSEPPRIVATRVEVEHCLPHKRATAPMNADDDCEDWGELRGPVTDVDAAQRAVQINGTWLRFPVGYEDNSMREDTAPRGSLLADDDDEDDELRPEDVQVGQRVRARSRQELGELLGFRLRQWGGAGERIRGFVEDIQLDAEGHLVGLRILHTDVVIQTSTEIE